MATLMRMGFIQRKEKSLNQYEIAVLYHPDLEVDISKAEDRVKKIISENKGKIVKTDNWGKRKLAYPIKKCSFAIYVFYTAELPPQSLQKIESTLNITGEVIRFLITKPDLKAIAKADVLKTKKLEQAAKRGENSEEEDKEKVES